MVSSGQEASLTALSSESEPRAAPWASTFCWLDSQTETSSHTVRPSQGTRVRSRGVRGGCGYLHFFPCSFWQLGLPFLPRMSCGCSGGLDPARGLCLPRSREEEKLASGWASLWLCYWFLLAVEWWWA